MDKMDLVSQQRLLVILGPTASGKTQLAVELAKRLNGAVISADSRQVYKGMDLGTGKDLGAYDNIPHYLIDVVEAGESYHVARYREDFQQAFDAIWAQGKQPILCGGTGMYIQAVVQGFNYAAVPVNPVLRAALAQVPLQTLREQLAQLSLPPDFSADTSTHKRLIRAIEIAAWYRSNPLPVHSDHPIRATLFGINPPVELRRQRITARLQQRLDDGLLKEVEALLEKGIPAEKLIYYGLEYKYATQYVLGELSYEVFFARLNTEIHRFAKRQMTYFRKMEKDGIPIHWLKTGTLSEMVEEILISQQ
ncbi:tRNA dimethylallyltransferase [Parapedobacter composti]|uniref:tRNA dimethylallyltransferase n=1 Tax=Parapedobacter composti TaxID=623281 RepID=A0A1I1IWH7_9SPHI|nr:tRNA (adenosine(37)-N6)-dimethylallyltransferase MiaA [Parapedobacter composti]SFC40606.1 tRNA dimethylallyltransferase [Parapedobacter composti]